MDAEENLKRLLDCIVHNPAYETISRDPEGTHKLFLAFNLWMDTFPGERADLSQDLDSLWVSALQKQLIWSIASVLSGSYINALVSMRVIFEMLVKCVTGTPECRTMRERLEGVQFLSSHERRTLQRQLWSELSDWAHPYDEWLDSVEKGLMQPESLALFRYDEGLFYLCLKKLLALCDFMLVVALEKGFVLPEKAEPYADQLGLSMARDRVDGIT